MEKNDQIVDSILRKVRTEVEQFVQIEPTIKCAIEYESKLLGIAFAITRTIVEGSQGDLPKSRNGKKKF